MSEEVPVKESVEETKSESSTLLSSSTPKEDWRTQLPEDIATAPSMANVKDITDLAKQFVNAQSLIGKPKLELPNENWTADDWNKHYNKLGRPETPDAYSVNTQVEGFVFSEDDKGNLLQSLHGAGLNNKQAEEVINTIANREVNLNKSVEEKILQEEQKATDELKNKYGDNFENQMKLANITLNKLVSPEQAEALSQFGNNPYFIDLLVNMGDKLMDDSAFKSEVSSDSWSSPLAAKAEINQLRGDPDFIAKLNGSQGRPAKDAAQSIWDEAFKKAYPS